MYRLFQNVVWPAVAGNVTWALLTVLIEWAPADPVFQAKLIALVSAAAYLSLDWIYTEVIRKDLPRKYWLADFFLAGATATFAITVQAGNGAWAAGALAFFFAVAIFGHARGAWPTPGHPRKRYVLAALNVVGLILLCWLLTWTSPQWAVAWAMAATGVLYSLALWRTIRKGIALM